MKILLRILLAPVFALLTILIWIATKIVELSAVVLNFIAIATAWGVGKYPQQEETENPPPGGIFCFEPFLIRKALLAKESESLAIFNCLCSFLRVEYRMRKCKLLQKT